MLPLLVLFFFVASRDGVDAAVDWLAATAVLTFFLVIAIAIAVGIYLVAF